MTYQLGAYKFLQQDIDDVNHDLSHQSGEGSAEKDWVRCHRLTRLDFPAPEMEFHVAG